MKPIRLIQKKQCFYSLFKDQKTDFEIEKIILRGRSFTIETTNVELKINEIFVTKNMIQGKNLVLDILQAETSEQQKEFPDMIEKSTFYKMNYTDLAGNEFQWELKKTKFERTEYGKRITEFSEKYNISALTARRIIEDFKL